MMLELVRFQHKHFNIEYTGKPRHLDPEEKSFYVCAIKEEASEYAAARTLEDEYDALLDTLVFTMGALLRHGFRPEGLVEVVKANITKEIGPLTKRGSFKLDLVKPRDWKAPDLKAYL